MSTHPARRSLQRDVLPYVVTARRLSSQWFYRLHVVFTYTTDIVVALTTLGVSVPMLSLLATTGATQEGAQPPTVQSALASVPSWFYWPTLVLVLAWVVLRVTFNREDGQKRAVLAKSCRLVLQQAEASLPAALSKPDPMPALTELLEKTIRPTVDRNIQEAAWPWLPFAPDIDQEVDRECQRLCARYETDWTPVADDGLDMRRTIASGV